MRGITPHAAVRESSCHSSTRHRSGRCLVAPALNQHRCALRRPEIRRDSNAIPGIHRRPWDHRGDCRGGLLLRRILTASPRRRRTPASLPGPSSTSGTPRSRIMPLTPVGLARRPRGDPGRGTRLLRAGCVNCHGGPGAQWRKFSEGLNPDPPDLKEIVGDIQPRELFWVVKNGIKMTGMPSFGAIGVYRSGDLVDRRLPEEAADRHGGGLKAWSAAGT